MTTKSKFRKASLEDLLWIIPLVKREFPHIKDPYRFMLSRLNFIWVLEDSEPIGFVDVEDYFIMAIVVKPEFRGKDYGKELLKFAIFLDGRKLISRKDNKRANKLYQKSGFKPVKKENDLIYWELCGSF